MSRWSRNSINKVVAANSEVIGPVLKSVIEKRHEGLVKTKLFESSDRRVVAIEIDLPYGKPYTIVFYTTAQESRPLSPRDIEKRLKRLRQFIAKNLPPQKDATIAILLASEKVRTTVGARRLLAEHHIKAVTPRQLLDIILHYIEKRLDALRKTIENGAKHSPEFLALFTVLNIMHHTLNAMLYPYG